MINIGTNGVLRQVKTNLASSKQMFTDVLKKVVAVRQATLLAVDHSITME